MNSSISIRLPKEPRIWLCGKVKYNEPLIDKATRYYDYFDGLIWVVDGECNQKHKLLESRKKAGEIIYRKWSNDHDIQMTLFLRTNKTKTFDWIVSIDGNEELNLDFVENLRLNIKEYQRQGIGAGMIGRPYLFQFYDDQIYTPNVHCWPQPLRGRFINLSENSIKKKIMDERSGLINPFIYWWIVGRTNECQMIYGKYGQEILSLHEKRRIFMRWYWQQNMEREFTLESVIEYLNMVYIDKSKIDTNFLEFIETEFRWSDIFRLKVLKQDLLTEIVPNRYSWSFKRWIETGDEKQINTEHLGTIQKYNRSIGIIKDD